MTSSIRNGIVGAGLPSEFSEAVSVFEVNPLFIDRLGADGVAGTVDDELQLLHSSPALDAGDPSLLPQDLWDLDLDGDTTEKLPVDLSGAPRIQGAGLDLGAYEGPSSVKAERPSIPDFGMDVYPNPASDWVRIRNQSPHDLTVDIMAIDGRRVDGITLPAGVTWSWSAKHHARGVYVVRAQSNSSTILKLVFLQ